jgi:predicted DNA-binding transcriptional regulator YafY
MERGYFLPSLRFETDELDAIVLGLRLVAERAKPVFNGAAQRAASKIASALGETQREGMIDIPLEAGPSRVASNSMSSVSFLGLRTCIAERALLTIRYRNAEGRASTREARPLGLTLFEEAWLLTIWCEIAQDFRHLRLDRIESAERTGRRFRPEKGKRFRDAIDIEKRKQRHPTKLG